MCIHCFSPNVAQNTLNFRQQSGSEVLPCSMFGRDTRCWSCNLTWGLEQTAYFSYSTAGVRRSGPLSQTNSVNVPSFSWRCCCWRGGNYDARHLQDSLDKSHSHRLPMCLSPSLPLSHTHTYTHSYIHFCKYLTRSHQSATDITAKDALSAWHAAAKLEICVITVGGVNMFGKGEEGGGTPGKSKKQI